MKYAGQKKTFRKTIKVVGKGLFYFLQGMSALTFPIFQTSDIKVPAGALLPELFINCILPEGSQE